MDRVTLFLSEELQKLIESDQKFRKSALAKHTFALVAFITEMVVTKNHPRATFRVKCKDLSQRHPQWSYRGHFEEVLKATTHSKIRLGIRDLDIKKGISLECHFLGSDGELVSTQFLAGHIKSSGVRYLRILC